MAAIETMRTDFLIEFPLLKAVERDDGAIEVEGVASDEGLDLESEIVKASGWLDGLAELRDKKDLVPAVLIEHEGLIMRKLSREDPRGLFLGKYTDCCQHPGGTGESCAWHGATRAVPRLSSLRDAITAMWTACWSRWAETCPLLQ